MSQKNVAFVRRVYALLDRGDEAVFGTCSRQISCSTSRAVSSTPLCSVVPTRCVPPYLRDLPGAWAGPPRWEPEQLIDAGDQVLAFIRTGNRGRASGVEVEARVWNLWTFRNGKLTNGSISEMTERRRTKPLASPVGISQENVEVVRAMYETVNGKLHGAPALLAPDAEFHLSGAFPDFDPLYQAVKGSRSSTISSTPRGRKSRWTQTGSSTSASAFCPQPLSGKGARWDRSEASLRPSVDAAGRAGGANGRLLGSTAGS